MRLSILIIYGIISVYAEESDAPLIPGPLTKPHAPPTVVFEDPPDCLQHTTDVNVCLYTLRNHTMVHMGSTIESLYGNKLTVDFQVDSTYPRWVGIGISEASGTFLAHEALPDGMRLIMDFHIPYFRLFNIDSVRPGTLFKQLRFRTRFATNVYVPDLGWLNTSSENMGEARAYMPGQANRGYLEISHPVEGRRGSLFSRATFNLVLATRDGLNWGLFDSYIDVVIQGPKHGGHFEHGGRLRIFEKSRPVLDS
ncbi:hypothetical protein Pmar_PMAR010837 [Perkinsus marinus ATCC 50983]|uniref:Uncharacterized protein n=1 Tax=Perkinsus marinus (strain ATCC 50983 / TXsc) TaxID=423536 RepID=C5KEA0_PERM5|nr:hypothetical protein Pmar_PMAR010837 [Perkinsus marinus ATCC 50983]EER17192.1 hypothetical protein Pmar_PMAR010837 [Perkinsus marinus ATCC 50983]|eukprot:XP_002785396.1 hypothetical protein Pmar_PMAR010837 [Perkinsus marinus ATCC 50983]